MKIFILILFALILAQVPINGQPAADSTSTLDANARAQVIDALSKNLKKSYVHLEMAQKMEADLRQRLKNKEYDQITKGEDFAKRLMQDLQAVSRDKHLRVSYSAEKLPEKTKGEIPATDDKIADLFFQNRLNSGFDKVERMEGNIGYIALGSFMNAELGVETVSFAMSFVANTDALIFDLRNSGGGDPAMVALICSYFFDAIPFSASCSARFL